MKGKCTTLTYILLTFFLLLCFKTTSVNAEKITDADVVAIQEKRDHNELTVSYVLEDKKNLIIKTNEKNVIDIDALKKEIGTDNVEEHSNENEIILTLNDPNKIDFKLLINNEKPFKLDVTDSDHKSLFYQEFNQSELSQIQTRIEAIDLDETSWIPLDQLRVSEGPTLFHKDGSTTKPLLYFGDYINAAEGQTIATAFSPRGAARQNSLTAANFAVLHAEKGSRIEEGPQAPLNHIYTSHYGDNQGLDSGLDPLNIEDRPFGSVNSFISNNLYNSVNRSDDWIKPATSGPDKNGYSYAMSGKPSFYYRKSPETGFEEQRMVYLQKAYPVEKNGRENRKVLTTVKLSFNSAGKVVVNIKFQNVGDRTFYNFSGFSNHDLSLNKDGREIEKPKTYNDDVPTERLSQKEKEKNKRDLRKIGNYVPMRSLGNQRGMYIESGNKEVRTSFYTNHPNGPGAWAARSIGKSYLATKGFMHIPPTKERFYPWKSGKPMHRPGFNKNHYYNDYTHRFKSPFVPQYKFNAFDHQRDPGDKNTRFAYQAGARLGAEEREPLWDAGFTMRTTPTDLKAGDAVELEYATQMDIKSNTSVPVIELDHQGIPSEPELIPIGQDTFSIRGSWYDFDSPKVRMKYSIDNETFKDAPTLFDDEQTEKEFGKIQDFISLNSIPLSDLDTNKTHTIRFQMNDWDGDSDQEGNHSRVKETVIKFIREPTNRPQIHVTTPISSRDEPHNPFDHKIDFNGVWTDKDSKKIKSLTYALEDGIEVPIEAPLDNPSPGELNRWSIKGLNIQQHNDFDTHKITFRITDDNGETGKEVFHFKHLPGSIQLIAPKEIDFGRTPIALETSSPIKPDFKNEKLTVFDFREKNTNPVDVALTIKRFNKVNGSEGEEDQNDSDDGGDSNSTSDPDLRNNGPQSGVMIKRESLRHTVYWQNKRVSGKKLIVGQTSDSSEKDWQQETDLTDTILDNLKIRFRANLTGSSPGTYISHWTWQTIDSIK